MGCTGSKQATGGTEISSTTAVANPAAEAPVELGVDTKPTNEAAATPASSEPTTPVPAASETKPVEEAAAPVTEEAPKASEETPAPVETPAADDATPAPVAENSAAPEDEEELVPKYHIDEFGNKIDDVTGGRVWSYAYYRARKDAEFHAQERGRCFEASKKAFEEDRKKEAKELSEEGKSHGVKMEEANQRAVDEIIKPQNLETSEKIDLHGLLVAEAVKATKDFVKSVIATRGDSVEKLEIITGAGHHSDKAKGPVIKPAIITMCQEEGWKLVADESNEGSFTLFLKDPAPAADAQ